MTYMDEKVVLIIPKGFKLIVISELLLLQQYSSIIDILPDEINFIIQKNVNLKEDVNLLITIPGIGENTASQIVVELPPIDWFQNSK